MNDENAFVGQHAVRLLDLLVKIKQTVAPGDHEYRLEHERIELACGLESFVNLCFVTIRALYSFIVLDCNQNNAK